MIHPLIGNDERTVRFGQMGDGILCQHCKAIRSDQLRNTMVDLFINMVRTSGKDNTFHMVLLHVSQGHLTVALNRSVDKFKLFPGLLDGFFDLTRVNTEACSKLFNKTFFQMTFTFKSHERIHKQNGRISQFFNVILDILSIRSNNRAVVIVGGTFCFLALIRNTWIEDEFHIMLQQPHNMTMNKLGRIAGGFTRNGFNTKIVDFMGRFR